MIYKNKISKASFKGVEIIRPKDPDSIQKEANTKLETLRSALIEGEESVDTGELDIETIRQSVKYKAGL